MNKRYYIVMHDGDTSPYQTYDTHEHAEAVRRLKEFDYPTLGPWYVVEVEETPRGGRA